MQSETRDRFSMTSIYPIIKSKTFSGLWLASQAMLSMNLAEHLTRLQQGLAPVKPRTFVEQLRNV
jgi:hypothetical protein